MAKGRISGRLLRDDLARDENLTFNTNTLVVDYANSKIAIGTATATDLLTVSGNVTADNLQISNNTISSLDTNADIVLDPNGTGNINMSGATINNVADPTQDQDVATKEYVDNIAGNTEELLGNEISLGLPTDGNLQVPGAINYWTVSTTVTDAIDDLNELVENQFNDTFVRVLDFVADNTLVSSGQEVTLTITTTGNPTHYTIDWGDGNTTTATTDSTPSHTYTVTEVTQFDVTVTAYNETGTGAGSTSTKTKEDYITVYTAVVVVGFDIYANPTGGSPIDYWDDGATVYFENTSTNIAAPINATIQYTIDWGDSESDDVITDNTANGGTEGGRLAHTFTASTEEEVQRTVSLTVDSHSTALPSLIPSTTSTVYEVYDTHTPTLTVDDNSGINEEATTGHPVVITNTTETTVGDFATYGIQYQYQWGDGTADVTVDVGGGDDGDTSATIAHTYALSSSNQANGTPVDYVGNLRVISNHTSSPFVSTNFTIHVEPDVVAIISGTATTVGDGDSTDQYDLYDGVDYNGNNRALVRITNTSQNADSYVYDWGDTSANDNVTEDGTSPGSIGATITHDFTGEAAGNYNLTFTASGTPDITAQTDVDTSITFQLSALPTAPGDLSTKSLILDDNHQGLAPRLTAGFTDNTTSSPLTAGDSLTTTTARRYTSGTIDTNVIDNANSGLTGTLTAMVNGVDRGNKTFTTATGENGTFTSLVVSDNDDAHETISTTYPTGFYQTFDAKITQALTGYTVGANDERLEHSTTGNTNYVSVVYDDVTVVPTNTAGTLTEGTAGTKKYISGVPYYDAGNPTVVLTGVDVDDLTGQAYRDTDDIVIVASATNQEGTSQNAISTTEFDYSEIDGATTMLTGGIPNANVGVGSAYTLGDLTVPITTSNVRTVDRIRTRAVNCNGAGSYVENTTNLNVHTANQSNISEIAIAVSDDLGAGFNDDGVRIFDFSADTTDTPSYTGSTNFYTNSPYTEASDPGVVGTREATIRLGVLEHNVVDYSTGYLPAGPNRSGDTGTQYFTMAFRRTTMANFDINITSSGIAGLWIAAPGTGIDTASGLNGWVRADTTYAGSGVPGSNTGSGGNGSNGCAFTSGDRIASGTSLSGGYTMTLGSENGTNATGNVVLVRIALTSGQSVTQLSVGEAS